MAGYEYTLTIEGHRTATGARRTFTIQRVGFTARDARMSLGNQSVVDPTDSAWFDEWRITSTRRTRHATR